jgi:hypothetical protein
MLTTPPLALSDSEITTIMSAARPLQPSDRQDFLEAVATALQGRQLGDGVVFATCRELQKRYLMPSSPDRKKAPPSKWSRAG